MANLYGKSFWVARNFGARNFAIGLCKLTIRLLKMKCALLKIENKKEPNFFPKFPALTEFKRANSRSDVM
jgi:hypothetical protein